MLYLCGVKIARCIAFVVIAAAAVLWLRMPIFTGALTKQTLFVAVHDALNLRERSEPTLMWIDDDGGQGVMSVKRLSDEFGMFASFAIAPALLDDAVADSLRRWQQQGFGIVLHGMRHELWRDWTEQQIEADIRESRKALSAMGFDTLRLQPIIVPPYAANTQTVRKVIGKCGCKMVTGAQLVNPSPDVPYWGRLWIDRATSTEEVKRVLLRVKETGGFIVLGTHSSNSEEFSEEKMRAVLQMAKKFGYI